MDSQIVLATTRLRDAFNSSPSHIWKSSLMGPAYVAMASALVLLLHVLIQWIRSKRDSDVTPETTTTSTGIIGDIKSHIRSHGGTTVYVYKFLRLIGCLATLGFCIATFILDQPAVFSDSKKGGKKKHHHEKKALTEKEWLDFAMILVMAYASLLALLSVSLSFKKSKRVLPHLVVVLLVVFFTYVVRDVWPLMTYTLAPRDQNEGWLWWAKLGALGLSGVLIPLLVPSTYVPFDPKDPQDAPTPEQTTSILSLVLWTYLDPLIFKAYRAEKFDRAELPPIADTDMAKNLRTTGFKELDTFSGAKKGRHIFWGIVRIYWKEFTMMGLFCVAQVVFEMASPIGINQLLKYIENGGRNAFVQPWVWILWLLFAPIIHTVAWQMYIYLSTRSLVRTEGLITLLVFEHALRMRQGARSGDSKGSSSKATTPAQPATPATEREEESETGGSQVSGDETLTGSTTIKGKDAEDAAKKEDDEGPENNLAGKINNLVTSDLDSLVNGRDLLLVFVNVPFTVGLGTWFLYSILGWAAFIGVASIIVLFPVPGYVAKLIQGAQTARMKKTDARVQTVTEAMNVIRMIKLFGWERKIQDRISSRRNPELVAIRWRILLDMTNNITTFIIPIVTMIVTYVTFSVVMKQQLTASIVFSSMSVFDMLRNQMGMIFWQLPALIEAKVSLERVQDFLRETELLDEYREKSENDEVGDLIISHPESQDKIGFRDATFTWSDTPITKSAATPSKRTFVLTIENELLIKKGEFTIVIGPTSAGKTAFLMALLGEMHFIRNSPSSWFNLPRTEGVAYCAQESWVMNETIKENIVFGEEFDQVRYDKVIYQCGLSRDLELFEAGDATEVGEKGLTLSGGQKARVTLARAIYSSAKIILLDDVLAALDVHTSKWIVEKCFAGDLVKDTGRTVVLVTHNVALAKPLAQNVLAVSSTGKVSAGTLADLLLKDPKLVVDVAKEAEALEKAEQEVDAVDGEAPAADKKGDGKLVAAEEVEEGHIGWEALKLFFGSIAGRWGLLFWAAFLGAFLISTLMNTMSVWFLGYFASQYDNRPAPEVNVGFYLGIYVAILATDLLFHASARLIFLSGAIRAMRTIHMRLVESVLGTTLRWLDSTPVSRVIARCTQDIRAIDGEIPDLFEGVVQISVEMVAKLIGVLIFVPLAIIPSVIISVLGGIFGQIYIKAQLIVKRDMSNARAPVLAVIQASSAGLVSIRAYGAQERFKKMSMQKIDLYVRSARLFYNLNRWICVRVDTLGALFSSGLAAYLLYIGKEKASDTGFSLNMCIGFSGLILWWVRLLNMFEVAGNSLERINGYLKIDHEPKPTPQGEVPASWPTSGDLHVEKLTARYSHDGPAVLHGISFDVRSGERIGIVGRTGSGKSSLTLALLRAIPLEGSIRYDGRETTQMNLDALRENITIIPQVPELLSGTLRQNLDPFDQYDDPTLNEALRSAGLFSLQQDTPEEDRVTLDTSIAAGGGNLSVGERQIFALARAIVRQSKILILDEATSAIDYKTDSIIQRSLREGLSKDITVITVAHRLQTIMDADRIMVLDAGNIKEYDLPIRLLENSKGLLRSLVDESGDKEALTEMAKSHASTK